jgi:hypothetical protein
VFLVVENAKAPTILSQLIAEAREIREKMINAVQHNDKRTPMSMVGDILMLGRIVGTTNVNMELPRLLQVDECLSRTLVRTDMDDNDRTLVPDMLKNSGSLSAKMSTLTEELNTMVINNDETDDEATMKSKE